MDERSARQRERTALKRIVARLLSLADVADFACRCPHPVRVLILVILRYAEWVAWDFVTGQPQGPADALPSGDSLENAAQLAQRFRDLACALDWQINYDAAMEALLPAGQWLPLRPNPDRIKNALDAIADIARRAMDQMPRATGPPSA